MINAPLNVRNALTSGNFKSANLVTVNLGDAYDLGSDTILYLTDYHHAISFGGNTYTPDNNLTELAGISRKASTGSDALEIVFGITDPTLIDAIKSRRYINKPTSIDRVIIEDGAVVDNFSIPIRTAWGLNHSFPSGDDRTVELIIDSVLGDISGDNGWFAVTSSHQQRQPGDNIMRHSQTVMTEEQQKRYTANFRGEINSEVKPPALSKIYGYKNAKLVPICELYHRKSHSTYRHYYTTWIYVINIGECEEVDLPNLMKSGEKFGPTIVSDESTDFSGWSMRMRTPAENEVSVQIDPKLNFWRDRMDSGELSRLQGMYGKGLTLLFLQNRNRDDWLTTPPDLSVPVKGAKVYDPRTTQTVFSRNPALQYADYIRSTEYGAGKRGIPITDANIGQLANHFDELPDSAGNPGINDIRIDVQVDTGKSIVDNINIWMEGVRIFTSDYYGEFTVRVESKEPTSWVLDETELLDVPEYDAGEFTERINELTYSIKQLVPDTTPDADPNSLVEVDVESTFPPEGSQIKSDWLAEDGGIVNYESEQLDYVTELEQAYYWTMVDARISRKPEKLVLPVDSRGWLTEVGDVIDFSSTLLNMTNELFRVEEVSEDDEVTELTLVAYDDSFYTPDPNVVPDPIPFAAPPIDTRLDAVSGLAIIEINNQFNLTWTPLADASVRWYAVEVIKDGTTTVYDDPRFSQPPFLLSDIVIGSYEAKVTPIGINNEGSTSSLFFSIDVPETPTLAVNADNFSVSIIPTITGSYIGVSFELMLGTDSDFANATNYGISGAFTVAGLSPDTDYWYWVRSVSSVGNSLWASGTIKTTAQASEILDLLVSQIDDTHFVQALNDRIDLIDITDIGNGLGGLVELTTGTGGHGARISTNEVSINDHATRLTVLEASTAPLLDSWTGNVTLPDNTDINGAHPEILTSSHVGSGSVRVKIDQSTKGFGIGLNGVVIDANYVGLTDNSIWYTFEVSNIVNGDNTVSLWSQDADQPVLTEIELRSGAASFESRIVDLETVTGNHATQIDQLNTIVRDPATGLVEKVAAVEVQANTNATELGEVTADYTIKVDANGVVAGIGLIADSVTAASRLYLSADVVGIVNAGETDPDANYADMPFYVTDGITVIKSAHVTDLKAQWIDGGDLTIDNLNVDFGGSVNFPAGSLSPDVLPDSFLNSLVYTDPNAQVTGGTRSNTEEPVVGVKLYADPSRTNPLLSGGQTTNLTVNINGGRGLGTRSTSPLTAPEITFMVKRKNLTDNTADETVVSSTTVTGTVDVEAEPGLPTFYITNISYTQNWDLGTALNNKEYDYWVDIVSKTGDWSSSGVSGGSGTIAVTEALGSSGGVLVEWDGIQNTPTTLAGYGITDAISTSGGVITGDLQVSGMEIDGNLGIYFENKKHLISYNDGKGNFNIRVANDENENCTEAGYAFQDEWSQTSGWRQFNVSNASLNVGDPVVWREQIYYDFNSVQLNYQGNKKIETKVTGAEITGTLNATTSLQEAGVNLSAKYLGISAKAVDASNADNADLFDNLNSTQFLRSDANDSASGNITFTGVLTNTVDGKTGEVVNEAYVDYNYPRAEYSAASADLNNVYWNEKSRIQSVDVSANAPSPGNGWYNVLNMRHRNGEGDGTSYGCQIAATMNHNSGRVFFRNQSGATSRSPWYEFVTTKGGTYGGNNSWNGTQFYSNTVTFNGDVIVDKTKDSSGRVLTYDFSVSPDSGVGDLDGYFDVGESVDLFGIDPNGNSRNHYFECKVNVQSGVSQQTLFIRLNTRSNTLPDLSWYATYDKESNTQYDPATPVLWVDESTTGSIKVALKFNSSGIHNIEATLKVFQRSNYSDVQVNAEHRGVETPPSGFTEYEITNRLDTTSDGQTLDVIHYAPDHEATSDRRVKTDAAPILNALDNIDLLQGDTFNRIDMQGKRHAGTYADDWLKVLPEAVNIRKGVDTSTGIEDKMSVSPQAQIGYLVECVKELKAEVKQAKRHNKWQLMTLLLGYLAILSYLIG